MFNTRQSTRDKSDMPASSQFLRFEATERDLEPSSLKKIQASIGETEDAKKKGLEILTKKLKELKDIEPCLDESFLLKFLRLESFDASKALNRIKSYYAMQEIALKMFRESSIKDSVVQRYDQYFCAMPYRQEDYSPVITGRMGVVDFSELSFDIKNYLELVVVDHIMRNPVNQMSGVAFLCDWSGFRLLSFLSFKPFTIAKLLNHATKSLPLRIKEIHVVNAHSVFRILYNILSFIFPKDLRQKIIFHPNDGWKSLHEYISPQILSEEYGGSIKKSNLINLLENAKEFEKQFCELFSYGYVDTKEQRMSFRVIQ